MDGFKYEGQTWQYLTGLTDRLKTDNYVGFSSIFPVLVLFFVFVVTPMAYGVWASFHNINALNPQWGWAGLGNYVTLLSDPFFQEALWNGVVFSVGSVIIQLVIGLGVGLLLHKAQNRLLTAVSLALYVIPTIVIVYIWQWMFDERYGILVLLPQRLGLLSDAYSVFADPTLAMATAIFVGSYNYAVFMTLMILAQLESIPASEYEAATISGATTLQKFVYITWPQIRNAVFIVVLLRGIFMFNKFDLIYILTGGGPGEATTTLPIWVFQIMFQDLAYGQATALAVLMFLVLAIGGTIYFVVFNPEEDIKEAT